MMLFVKKKFQCIFDLFYIALINDYIVLVYLYIQVQLIFFKFNDKNINVKE